MDTLAESRLMRKGCHGCKKWCGETWNEIVKRTKQVRVEKRRQEASEAGEDRAEQSEPDDYCKEARLKGKRRRLVTETL